MGKRALLISLLSFISCALCGAQEIRHNIIALRTNLLLPLLNAGLEVPVSSHLSVSGDVYYPWIGFDKANASCVQAGLADIQIHWFLKPRTIRGYKGNTMTGPVISLGACSGLYDFERNMKGFQGEIAGVYLDFGYAFYPSDHYRISLSIGAGVARLPYRTYTVYSEGGRLIRDNSKVDYLKQWIGPLHASVVLQVPFAAGGGQRK